jgi:hypothetical protein
VIRRSLCDGVHSTTRVHGSKRPASVFGSVKTMACA